MKQVYLISLLFLLLSSCNYEEKDLFDQTPAERLNNAINDTYTNLTNAANGWEMAYFTNPENAGYTLLVKFRKDGKAIVASQSSLTQNEAYEQDSSLFELIADYGPVLTFNTYNKVLHRFSNPENPDGYGYEGDYEFVVIKNSEEQIILKGKKYKSIIVLTKLNSTVNWITHLQELTNTDKLLFSANAPKLTMTTKNGTYSFTEGYKHVFLMKKDGTTTTTRVPFIITKQGIRLQQEIEIDGLKFQNFELSADYTALISKENPTYKLSGTEDLATFAMNNIKDWKLNPENMSESLKSSYNTVLNSFKATYNADSMSLNITYLINRFVLNVKYSQATVSNEGKIDMEIIPTAKDALSLNKKTASDTNGTKFLNEIPELTNFINLLSTNYTLSTVTKLNPRTIWFSKKTDTNQWFIISGE